MRKAKPKSITVLCGRRRRRARAEHKGNRRRILPKKRRIDSPLRSASLCARVIKLKIKRPALLPGQNAYRFLFQRAFLFPPLFLSPLVYAHYADKRVYLVKCARAKEGRACSATLIVSHISPRKKRERMGRKEE